MSTASEKVYMAKLAVLISSPKTGTTHCPSALFVLFPAEGPTQGRRLVCKVPRSRANCSKVRGRNEPGNHMSIFHFSVVNMIKELWFHEPTPQTANTSAAIPYEYQPRISRRLVGVVSSPAYRGGRCCTPSAGDGAWKAADIEDNIEEC